MNSFRNMRLPILAFLPFAGVSFGQSIFETPTPSSDPYFPKPSYFRKHFATTETHVELQPPVRLSDFVVDNKLELSLKNYLDLVMANNPDVGVQKITLQINRDAVTRAFSIFDPIGTARFSATRTQTPSGSVLEGVQADGGPTATQ